MVQHFPKSNPVSHRFMFWDQLSRERMWNHCMHCRRPWIKRGLLQPYPDCLYRVNTLRKHSKSWPRFRPKQCSNRCCRIYCGSEKICSIPFTSGISFIKWFSIPTCKVCVDDGHVPQAPMSSSLTIPFSNPW